GLVRASRYEQLLARVDLYAALVPQLGGDGLAQLYEAARLRVDDVGMRLRDGLPRGLLDGPRGIEVGASRGQVDGLHPSLAQVPDLVRQPRSRLGLHVPKPRRT